MKFTSDTHFSSQRTLELSRRPYKTTEEMDKDMIRLWNATVSPDEEVYHLGDFGNYEIVKKLNGRIHLILGNYERKDIEEGKVTKEELLNYGFVSVDDFIILDNFNEKLPNIKKLKLVHEPSKCKKDNEYFNLFGHIHGRQMCKRFGLDVGVDGHHMKPIDKDDVSFYMEAILKYYDDEVFC